MPGLVFIPVGYDAWPDLTKKAALGQLVNVDDIQITVLPEGTKSGRPSVAIRADLPDGQTVVLQLTARHFVMTAQMVAASHPGLFEGPE